MHQCRENVALTKRLDGRRLRADKTTRHRPGGEAQRRSVSATGLAQWSGAALLIVHAASSHCSRHSHRCWSLRRHDCVRAGGKGRPRPGERTGGAAAAGAEEGGQREEGGPSATGGRGARQRGGGEHRMRWRGGTERTAQATAAQRPTARAAASGAAAPVPQQRAVCLCALPPVRRPVPPSPPQPSHAVAHGSAAVRVFLTSSRCGRESRQGGGMGRLFWTRWAVRSVCCCFLVSFVSRSQRRLGWPIVRPSDRPSAAMQSNNFANFNAAFPPQGGAATQPNTARQCQSHSDNRRRTDRERAAAGESDWSPLNPTGRRPIDTIHRMCTQ